MLLYYIHRGCRNDGFEMCNGTDETEGESSERMGARKWHEKMSNILYISLHRIHFTVFFSFVSLDSSHFGHYYEKGMLSTIINSMLLMLHDLLSFASSFIHSFSISFALSLYHTLHHLFDIDQPQLNTAKHFSGGEINSIISMVGLSFACVRVCVLFHPLPRYCEREKRVANAISDF